jgi:diguanylate cyclase (GGDEF)-like protein
MALLPQGGTEPLTMLVVDPSPIARQSLVRLLEARGHAVQGAADPAEAWARLAVNAVDVVLADWPAPDGAALDLVARLRARELDGVPYTAVGLLVAPTGRAAVPAALAVGADGHLPAPVDEASLDALLPVLARLVRLERRLKGREELVRQQEGILREEVRRDPLTQLGNRLRLEEDLRRLRGRVLRYGHREAAVLLGIDHFRRYQEALGRPAGDDLLRRVASIVRDSLRDGDGAYRFAPEQLLVLLPEQGEDGGLIVAERCRARVAALRIEHPRSDVAGTVTLSAGVAVLRGRGDGARDAWLLGVEQALDAARASGGDAIARGEHTRVAGPMAERTT